MKSAIVYYSFSGNTRKVAQILSDELRQKGEVENIELKAEKESSSFFVQAIRALFRKRTELKDIKFDLGEYDFVCFGTPVWAFGPAPAMNTFLDKCTGLEGKEAVIFTTYGSGTGNNNCLNHMQNILVKKGAKSFKRFSIQQFKVDNKDFVLSKIKEII